MAGPLWESAILHLTRNLSRKQGGLSIRETERYLGLVKTEPCSRINVRKNTPSGETLQAVFLQFLEKALHNAVS